MGVCQEPGVRRRVGGWVDWDMVGLWVVVRVVEKGCVDRWGDELSGLGFLYSWLYG